MDDCPKNYLFLFQIILYNSLSVSCIIMTKNLDNRGLGSQIVKPCHACCLGKDLCLDLYFCVSEIFKGDLTTFVLDNEIIYFC